MTHCIKCGKEIDHTYFKKVKRQQDDEQGKATWEEYHFYCERCLDEDN